MSDLAAVHLLLSSLLPSKNVPKRSKTKSFNLNDNICVRACGGRARACRVPASHSERSIFMKGESVVQSNFMDFTCLFYGGLSGR